MMINQETVSTLKTWFSDYVETFRSGDQEQDRNIDLKDEHTRRVCTEILDIGRSLRLNLEDLFLAELTALFHDVGRLEQYARYGTFSDRKSEDHAKLGVKILRKYDVLKGLDPSTRELILKVISYHNRVEIPEGETEACVFFAKLLRDADKLDIWRVVTDYYRQVDGLRNGTIELGLPDGPEISDEVCADLKAGKIVRMRSMKTLNDFKLLQMAWIYDVNFPRTFEILRERGYMEMIRDALPQSEKVAEMYATIRSYLEERIRQSQV
jgi:putative nucleotidyltransferase with HDIG domain